MDGKAKYKSYGFRGKLWDMGEIAENITPDESEMKEMKHFELYGEIPDGKNLKPEIKSLVSPPSPTECDKEPADKTPPTPSTLNEMERKNQLQLFNKAQLREKLVAAGIEITGNPNKEALIELCYQNKIKVD